jgi:2-succinyl-6-hydroxy-2,4-cyclohexadiene-1-carboxylate synthase
VKIHRLGPPGQPLLALHGFTGSGMDFEALAPLLGVGMLAPDLPGHLDTPPMTMAEAVEVLAPLAEGRVVMGYSMGGRVALQVACAVPVAALVLIGATPGIADAAARQARRASDDALADRIERIGVAAFLAEWSEKPIIATQRRIPEHWRAAMAERRRGHRAAGLAGSLRGMGTGAMASVWERMPDVPMLLVVGEEDRKFVGIAEGMAERVGGAEILRIVGAGHCAHLESLEIASVAIDGFVRRVGLG